MLRDDFLWGASTSGHHYRRMIGTALDLGLTPVVTLHHFTSPAWFAGQGGWMSEGSLDAFARYVETASSILEGVD